MAPTYPKTAITTISIKTYMPTSEASLSDVEVAATKFKKYLTSSAMPPTAK